MMMMPGQQSLITGEKELMGYSEQILQSNQADILNNQSVQLEPNYNPSSQS